MVVLGLSRHVTVALGVTGVLVALLVGTHLRLEDPSSSRVIPAEDPYNHMALVREHLRDGRVGPLNTGTSLYPPGMHAFVAATWVYTGLDLYEIFRFGPVVFGIIGILGMGLVLWRQEGPIAAAVGAFVYALLPETIFRTTMMAPTALDLALLPFLLLTLLEVLRGALAWATPASVLSLFLLFAHPWLFTVLILAGLAFVVLSFVFAWAPDPRRTMTGRGLAATIAILGVPTGISLNGCWGSCGPGFRDIVPDGTYLGVYTPIVAGAALVPLLVTTFAPRALDWLLPRGGPRPEWFSIACAGALVIAIALVTKTALDQGLPPSVDLIKMVGWPILILSFLAFVLVPFYARPLPNLAAGLFVATYPFVIFNPLDSPYWSHRTAAYLGVSLAILSGCLAGALMRLPAALPLARPAGRPSAPSRTRTAVAIAVPLLVLTSTGTVYAATPPADTWYRMFSPCEFETLEQVAARAADEPAAILISGDWQSKLVLAALTTNATRVWYNGDFFTSDQSRRGMLSLHRPVYAVVDPYLKKETPKADTSFLANPSWEQIAASCAGSDGQPRITVHAHPGEPT